MYTVSKNETFLHCTLQIRESDDDQNVTRMDNCNLAKRVRKMEKLLTKEINFSNKIEQQCDLLLRMEEQERLLKKIVGVVKLNDDQENLASQMAEKVDSVVGLREALTSKCISSKLIWSILLTIASAATVYYICKNISDFLGATSVTKIWQQKLPSYAYPLLVLCPPWWINVDNITDSDLSVGALQYSFGYASPWYSYKHRYDITDVQRANASFLKYYNEHRFQSLGDFFISIAASFKPNDLFYPNGNPSITLSLSCRSCVNEGEKIFLRNGVCYTFQLENATAYSAAVTLSAVHVSNYFNGTEIFFLNDNRWGFDLLPNVVRDAPAYSLNPYGTYMGKITATRTILLRNCIHSETYSQLACILDCFSHEYGDYVGETFNWRDKAPWQVKNFNDPDFPILIIPDTEQKDKDCYDSCQPACERITYDISMILQDQFHVTDNFSSTVWIHLFHMGVFEGSILTRQEIDTTTFADFTSNLGGTLGLFLGCTVMSIAQFVLALVDFVVARKRAKSTTVTLLK